MVAPEAPLESTKFGLRPGGEGWFVMNARESRWRDTGTLGAFCNFEGKRRFPGLGINLNVLRPGEPMGLYRALRRFSRVQETLYPLAPVFEPLSRWFLEPARRDDDALVASLRAAALRDDDRQVGVLHASNGRDDRGGFSLYVPEQSDGRRPMPLVVALHGGHGHGRDFLWAWLREARSREVLVLSPTSRDRTWSIMGGDDVDVEPLRQMVASVAERYPVDSTRVLLTGMSDGATYALLFRNSLVLALHSMACVAGFIAGSSLPLQAEHHHGWWRTVHEKAGPAAIVFVAGATTFSLCTQAYVLGNEADAIRYAQKELDDLTRQVEREMSRGTNSAALAGGAGENTQSRSNRIAQANGGQPAAPWIDPDQARGGWGRRPVDDRPDPTDERKALTSNFGTSPVSPSSQIRWSSSPEFLPCSTSWELPSRKDHRFNRDLPAGEAQARTRSDYATF
jgi:poly(3-hydroxybutyrate) depolymerase